MKNDSNDTMGAMESSLLIATLHSIKIILYFFISITGITANGMLLYALLGHRSLRVGEFLILNLAITDLATCIISIPFDIAEHLAGGFHFGSTLCLLVYPFQTILMAVSVITLLFMSLERRHIVIHTLLPRNLPKRATKFAICISWIIPVLAIIPYALVLRLDGANCLEKWDEQWHVKVFTLTYFTIFFVVPLCITATSYFVAGKKLRDGLKQLPDMFEGPERAKSEYIKRRTIQKLRVTRVFIIAVVAFFFCMLPTHLVWIWHDFSPGAREHRYFKDILVFANIFMYLNSVLNPFIFRNVSGKTFQNLMAVCCKVLGIRQKNVSLETVHPKKNQTGIEMEKSVRYTARQQICNDLNSFDTYHETYL
ncbi:PREDICTED: bombesin receptor subtype-3-like [Acropora digitifera]|uniref:bombesin receptor subtype-3-like n=1 Tax=Acropora digitifera TaxID=70779 RepID=UPI00077B245C|nr:PREDICTED: bombesin receptor subtype-3-like [Acropora digitifera]